MRVVPYELNLNVQVIDLLFFHLFTGLPAHTRRQVEVSYCEELVVLGFTGQVHRRVDSSTDNFFDFVLRVFQGECRLRPRFSF